ncbi:MAG TPA: DUF58 domain-containing protein [Longimicrobiales bacterium]|nr:DUF58 domain-containing protein [Longimicrobiales bacterium]
MTVHAHAHHRARSAASARFVDPEVLARIDDLELLARTVVDGFVAGLHRSPYLGFSLDFAEHRAYMPGDDIRRIDWRLFARTDRFYVKQFEAETNADVVLAVDVSASMGYGSGAVTKLDYARFLGAALAHLSTRQRDRVGLVTFADGPVESVPAAVRHGDHVLHALARARALGEGDLPDALTRVGDGLRRRGIVIVISDLYAEVDPLLEVLRSLRYRGQDVIVFHLLDPAELELPGDGAATYRDMETGERLPVVAEEAREAYRTRIREHVDALDRGLRGSRVEYTLLETSRPLDRALYRFLSLRSSRTRTR